MEDRRKALNELFHEYWDANLENSPEFASTIGDSRFNDKISDVSVKAFNNWLATEQTFLMRLAAIDPAWRREGEALVRDLERDSFAAAIEFVNAVAAQAELADHHPDILIHSYRRLRITLTTHAAGGLTDGDFALARAIDAL